MSDQDIDADELRTELDQIKDAMGIRERYDGATSVWLLFGLAVPVAAALSQYVHLEELPQLYHTGIWFAVLGGGAALYFAVVEDGPRPDWSAPGKPNLVVQFAVVYLAAVPLQAIVFAYTDDVGYAAESTLVLAVIVVMLGVAYGVFGASLRAFYVRRRDRWVFYVGTLWMVALGVAIPYTPFLETWAYAVYGGSYFVYAMAAYLVLREGGAGD
jgi:peptidoglycan/LPS O-acetylase OafA/YrhL